MKDLKHTLNSVLDHLELAYNHMHFILYHILLPITAQYKQQTTYYSLAYDINMAQQVKYFQVKTMTGVVH